MIKYIFFILIVLFSTQNLIFGQVNISNISDIMMSSPFPPPQRDGLLDNAFAPIVSLDANGTIGRFRVQNDGKILIGGNFTVVGGQLKTGIVRLNVNGTIDNTFNTTFDSGTGAGDFAIQPDGKIIVVGSFTQVNGNNSNRIARLNSDGSFDNTFNVGAGANDDVSTLSLQPDGRVIIGGNFSSINGTGRTNLARLNSDGSLDLSYNTNVLEFFVSPITQIEVQPNGQIYVSGWFSQINGVNHRGIVRLNADGSRDNGFSEVSGFNNLIVETFAVQSDGKVLIGGIFSSNTGTAPRGIARLNTDGTVDTSFVATADINESIQSISIRPDNKIIIGGPFKKINGVTKNNLALLNLDGTLDNTFGASFSNNANVRRIFQQIDGSLLIGGDFTAVNGNSRDNLARLDAAGNLDTTFQQNFAGFGLVNDVAKTSDGKILVAGSFDRVNGFFTDKIAKINQNGMVDSAFSVNSVTTVVSGGLGTSSIVETEIQPDGKIIIGGNFNTINGVSRIALARLNSDGSLDSTFDAGTGPNNTFTLEIAALADGKILIGGTFSLYNGVERKAFARLNADGSLDTSFLGNLNSGISNAADVEAILVDANGKIFIGGSFLSVNGTSINNIAKLNSDGSLDLTFTPPIPSGISASIRSLALQPDGKLLVGGWGVSNNQAPLLYRLNANGTQDSTFNSGKIGFGSSSEGVFSIISLPNGRILIGGQFSSINGVVRRNVARLISNGSLDYAFDPQNLSKSISAMLVQADGNLVVGGSFSQVNNIPRSGIARLLISGSFRQPFFDFDGDTKADISVFRPSNGVWYRLNSQNNSFNAIQFGLSQDKLAPADYDGDGRTDIAIFRDGVWYIINSGNSSVRIEQFGIQNDIPVPGDFDGDGNADLAVFRPSNGVWYLLKSHDGFGAIQFGQNGDRPLIGDFDNDGKGELVLFRPSTGVWYSLNLVTFGYQSIQFGLSEDIPTPADFDGDGKTDIAVFRPSTGVWYLLQSANGLFIYSFGLSEDIPVAGDYDGDGKADIAVWRPSSRVWYLQQSTARFSAFQFGLSEDKPTSASFIR